MSREGVARKSWFVYLIECRSGAIYCGIAVDVDARYAAHCAGKGARYTRANPPEKLLARIRYPDRGAASRAEYAIKKLTPAKKRALARDAMQLAGATEPRTPGAKPRRTRATTAASSPSEPT